MVPASRPRTESSNVRNAKALEQFTSVRNAAASTARTAWTRSWTNLIAKKGSKVPETTENLMWVVVAVSIVGTVLNARRNIWCFPLWIIANLFWIIYGYNKSAPAMTAMFAVYLGLAIYGWVFWNEKEKKT
jgi:nicotinamide riboside transporter PnuC